MNKNAKKTDISDIIQKVLSNNFEVTNYQFYSGTTLDTETFTIKLSDTETVTISHEKRDSK